MKKKKKTLKGSSFALILFIIFIVLFTDNLYETGKNNTEQVNENTKTVVNSVENVDQNIEETTAKTAGQNLKFDISMVPKRTNNAYAKINNNKPFFTNIEMELPDGTENYSNLDLLGRCQSAICNVGKSTLPKEKRGDISSVKPTGWKNKKYDFIDGKWVYNRCHLIGYQLTAENDNDKNLITGTRYLNVDGMLPLENKIANYVKRTSNHVIYRVTPVFEGDNLLASGVLMEAKSVEDNEIEFNVYCYNVQPNVKIDYKTGENFAD